MKEFRIGHGFDVHAVGAGDGVVLGGVRIPWDRGLQAHSDGDVVIHAICDALLGAAALGDLGAHFPDDDPSLAGADSAVLLDRVMALLRTRALEPVNVDVTVIAEEPRLTPHVRAMRETLAPRLGLPTDQVSVKATTHERLGALGAGEGIAAHAVVLVRDT